MSVHRVPGVPLGEHIARVAANLFYREGINSVGVDRVASEADVTKRTLYRYFRSKDVLIAESLRYVPRVRFPADGAPADRVVGAFTAMRALLVAEEYRGCAFIAATAELVDPNHPARVKVRERNAARRAWFRDRAAEAGIATPDVFAEQIDVLFDGAMTGAARLGSDGPVDAAITVVQTLLAASVPATPRRVRPAVATRSRRTAVSRN